MATVTGKINCVTCGKEKVTYNCKGCSKEFCFEDLTDHRQIFNKQLDDVENKRNLFQQILTEQTTNPQQQHSLIQQINQWEQDSINKIQQTAEEARELILKHPNKHINKIEFKLAQFNKQLKQIREENDFNEIHLNPLNDKLKQLEEQLDTPSSILIQHDPSSFINKISVIISPMSLFIPTINDNAEWIQNGITVAGGNGQGNGLNQLSYPLSVFIDDDQILYVADQHNHRIVEWKIGAKNGQVVAGGNGQGNQNNQLNHPRNVIVDKESDSLIICDYENQRVVRWPRRNGTCGETIISNINCWGLTMDSDDYLYVSDINKHEVRRWKMGDVNGTIVAGGNGRGSRLNQLNDPYYIFVDQDQAVYVSDRENHRVIKWMKGAKEGIIVAGGQGQGNGLTQLSNPRGIIVDQLGAIYAVDWHNHRVMRWPKGATQGSVLVGGNGVGEQGNQLTCPFDLSFDRQNNLYVVDAHNHRIQKFDIDTR